MGFALRWSVIMTKKKSLVQAMDTARHLSIAFPGSTYWVMDYPRKRAVVTGVDWVYRERVLEGWRCYCKFKNGEIS